MTEENVTGKILSSVTQILQKADEIAEKFDAARRQLEVLVSQLDDVAALDIYKEIARLEITSKAWDDIGKEIAHLLSALYNQNEHLYEIFNQTMTRIEQGVNTLSNDITKESPSLREMILELANRDTKGVKVSWWVKLWRDGIDGLRKNISWVILVFIAWFLYRAIFEPAITAFEERFIHHPHHETTNQNTGH